MKNTLPKFMIVGVLLLAPFIAYSKTKKTQLHTRVGLITGAYEGTYDGSFSVPTSVTIDYETFLHNSRSFYFKFTQAVDLPESRPFYTYGGVGMKFYDGSKGMSVDQEQPEISISSIPKLRYYYSADIGVSQVIVKSFGSIVQAFTSMLDIGVGAGGIYQYTNNIGFTGYVGASYGYGFSSVSVLGYTGRVMLGVSYYF